MNPSFARQLLAASLVAAALSGPATAQYAKPEVGSMDKVIEPYQKDEVGVDEKGLPGQPPASVPSDLTFNDEDGNAVTIGSYLYKDRPIVLWLGYFECPMLCDRMSGGMVRALRDVKLSAGREYSILNVSINPNEVPGIAKQKKDNYVRELQQPTGAAGWNLLTGSPESIAKLTQSVGYKFKAVTVSGETEYAHPAVLVILSPEGKITRYLYPDKESAGVEFDAQTMRLSLVEAADGKVGSTMDRFMLTCLRFDAHTGKYTKDAVALMKYAGALTVIIMAAVFLPLWIRAARSGGRDDRSGPGGRAVPAH